MLQLPYPLASTIVTWLVSLRLACSVLMSGHAAYILFLCGHASLVLCPVYLLQSISVLVVVNRLVLHQKHTSVPLAIIQNHVNQTSDCDQSPF